MSNIVFCTRWHDEDIHACFKRHISSRYEVQTMIKLGNIKDGVGRVSLFIFDKQLNKNAAEDIYNSLPYFLKERCNLICNLLEEDISIEVQDGYVVEVISYIDQVI